MNMFQPYYEINEKGAKLAHEMMSFSDYKEGSKTEEYRNCVDAAYEMAKKVAEVKPEQEDRIYYLANRYNAKIAEYFNTEIRIGAMCPSIMISGGSNFPVKKKEKQIAAWERNRERFAEAEKILEKIRNILYSKEQIKSGDANVIEKLEDELANLKNKQELMKRVNAYFRKNKTLVGCPDIDPDKAEALTDKVNDESNYEHKPFPGYALTNNNQNIHRIEGRLKEIKAAKEGGTKTTENEYCKVVENADIMRLQLIFNGKPSEEIRTVLKRNGFKWAPSQSAWQRHLNDNGRYALKRVLKALEEL